MQETQVKWQPVVMIIDGRLECECGALAVFVSGHLDKDRQYNQLDQVDCWCQACYIKYQEQEELEP